MNNTLDASDCVILFLFLSFPLVITIAVHLFKCKPLWLKNAQASNIIATVFLAFTLTAGFIPATLFLGLSSDVYVHGTQFVAIIFAYAIATPITAHFCLPVLYKLESSNIYQYLGLRFGRKTRHATTLVSVFQTVFFISLSIYVPAIAFHVICYLSMSTSIVIIGFIAITYTVLINDKAARIADSLLLLSMLVTILSVLIKGLLGNGGFDEVWNVALAGNRTELFHMSLDATTRNTFWTQTVGGIFVYLSLNVLNQFQFQRLLIIKNLKWSQVALWVECFILIIINLFAAAIGLCIYYRYAKCDPIVTKKISTADEILPLYVLETMEHSSGMQGLFLAGILSGCLSSTNAALHSLAAISLESMAMPTRLRRIFSRHHLAKTIAAIYGLLCLCISFIAEHLGMILQATLTLYGITGGPLLALFLVGMFSTAVEQKGALSGLIAGLVSGLVFGLASLQNQGSQLPTEIQDCQVSNQSFPLTYILETQTPILFPHSLPQMSYMWVAPFSFIITVLVAQIVSRVVVQLQKRTGRICHKVNQELLSPLFPMTFRSPEHLQPNITVYITQPSMEPGDIQYQLSIC